MNTIFRFLRPAMAAAALLLSGRPCLGQTPISDIHVQLSSAAVTGLECRGRKFRMELTKSVGQSYRQLSQGMFSKELDPRPIVMGLFGMVLMAPIIVLAVPADLAAGPFRRECSFDFQAQGALMSWAGQQAAGADVAVEGRNLLSPGTEGAAAPVFYVSHSTAASDEQGRFSVSIVGRVGRSRDFEVYWKVKGLSSGAMLLHKGMGGSFTLSEPEPEFGSSLQTMEPVEIRAERKR